MAQTFDAELRQVAELLDNSLLNPADLVEPLRTLSGGRPADITATQLRQMFDICYRVLGMAGDAPDFVTDAAHPNGQRQIEWTCSHMIEQTLFDTYLFNRASIENSAAHCRMFLRPLHSGLMDHYRAVPNVPLHTKDAAKLIAPYLASLEARMADHPYEHLKICWDVFTAPIAPFEGIFWDWINGLKARGLGNDEGRAMRQALSVHKIARKGRQCAGARDLTEALLPQLNDPHPLVVANMGVFLGGFFADIEDRFLGEGLMTMPEILNYLSGLKAHRRAAAGGFLFGMDSLDGGPLVDLRAHPEIVDTGFDIDDWVLDILSDGQDEPYMPGAQAFWFFLHEDYCTSPDMVIRMIDAGHYWVAWMCITEINPPDPVMTPALEHMIVHGAADFVEPARARLSDTQTS